MSRTRNVPREQKKGKATGEKFGEKMRTTAKKKRGRRPVDKNHATWNRDCVTKITRNKPYGGGSQCWGIVSHRKVDDDEPELQIYQYSSDGSEICSGPFQVVVDQGSGVVQKAASLYNWAKSLCSTIAAWLHPEDWF
jgi:hypothetical protein